MASTDRVSLRAARQSAFLTQATPWSDSKTGVTATLSAGTVTFGSLTSMSSSPLPIAGDIIYVSGFGGANAGWNGFYEVKTSGQASDTTLACYCPAGKNVLSNASASTGTVTLSALTPMRIASEDLQGNLDKRESEEITGSRGVQDLTVNGITASGPIDSELSLPAWTPQIQAAFMSPWTYEGAASVCVDDASVTFDSATDMIRSAPDTFAGIQVGEWIKISGSTHNDGLYRVAAIDNSSDPRTLTVEYGTLSTTVSTEDITIQIADSLTEGSTLFPQTIERVYADITGGDVNYPRFIGMLIESLSISASAQGPVTISTQWLGSREYGTGTGESGTPTSAIGTPSTRPTGNVLEGVSDIQLWLDEATGGCVNQLDMSITNNLDPRLCIGTLGATSMEARQFSASGSFSRYYSSAAVYDKFMNSTAIEMVIKLISPNGPALVFEFPRVELSSASRGAPGRNQSLFLNANFTALEGTGGYTCKLYRWEA